jgi:hypothetical protein
MKLQQYEQRSEFAPGQAEADDPSLRPTALTAERITKHPYGDLNPE